MRFYFDRIPYSMNKDRPTATLSYTKDLPPSNGSGSDNTAGYSNAPEIVRREPVFSGAATISNRLVDRCVPDVPSQILESLLHLTLDLFHRGGDWWLRRATEQTGKRPHIREPASLSGYESDIYERAMRGFVATWEKCQHYPKRIWKWETNTFPPIERWERLRASVGFIREYFDCTAYMVAAAVWRGDEFSASVMSDSLIMWPNSLEYEFGDDPWLKTELLNADLCGHSWENALIVLQCQTPELTINRDRGGICRN